MTILLQPSTSPGFPLPEAQLAILREAKRRLRKKSNAGKESNNDKRR